MLRRLERVLDQFEEELRHGGNRRLGGGQICVADITLLLGLYLHRLYQLGLDTAYYQDGVWSHLSMFYQSIKSRTSFEARRCCA